MECSPVRISETRVTRPSFYDSSQNPVTNRFGMRVVSDGLSYAPLKMTSGGYRKMGRYVTLRGEKTHPTPFAEAALR